MLLRIRTTHQPATDLGYLLHKHPDRVQSFKLPMGEARLFYPERTETACTFALLLDIDPIDLVRKSKKLAGRSFTLGQYVNDRPYVASSFLSTAISKTLSTALNGRCKDKPLLVKQAIPLEVELHVVPAAKGGAELIRRLFEPLGYEMRMENYPLDEQQSDWGASRYFSLYLKHHITLSALLQHLYVLIPVLDNDKHYYVDHQEINKLLEKGEGWLEEHPEREQITRRYLIHLRSLSNEALSRLEAEAEEQPALPEEEQKRRKNLHQLRLEQVLAQLQQIGAKSVLDLGCGEGKLLRKLLKKRQFERIVGMDVSSNSLQYAKERLNWEEMPPAQRKRIDLFQGALTYKDKRLSGFDAAAIVEVIEHLEPHRLPAFERVVFEFAQPRHVILTTPNAEYNDLFEQLNAGQMRHEDHRFEWTRAEFQEWANRVAQNHGYRVSFLPVGPMDAEKGAPSQMAIFTYEH